jgi:pimeloyl-ACP methyl ester carboxylesterase
LVFIFIIFYSLVFFQIEKIERLMTFPGVWVQVNHTLKTPENMEEYNIQIAGWNTINGIYLWNSQGKTVYYFHGNGVPLPYFYNEINYIHSLGYNVMAYDYPGYGKSSWMPTQKI